MNRPTWTRTHHSKPHSENDRKARAVRRVMNSIFGPPERPPMRPSKQIELAVRRQERRRRREEGRF